MGESSEEITEKGKPLNFDEALIVVIQQIITQTVDYFQPMIRDLEHRVDELEREVDSLKRQGAAEERGE